MPLLALIQPIYLVSIRDTNKFRTCYHYSYISIDYHPGNIHNQLIWIVSIMLSVNIGLSFVQAAVTDVNPGGPQFIDIENTPYANYVQNEQLVVGDEYLPEDDAVTASSSGNVFTDTYRSMKSWVESRLSGLGFQLIYSYRNQPGPGEPELQSHLGHCELLFAPDLQCAEGHYFNGVGRFTHGTMTLKKGSSNATQS